MDNTTFVQPAKRIRQNSYRKISSKHRQKRRKGKSSSPTNALSVKTLSTKQKSYPNSFRTTTVASAATGTATLGQYPEEAVDTAEALVVVAAAEVAVLGAVGNILRLFILH
ncbi:MAG: hypothetical protein J6Y37_16965 [Paludibacteraceae bacterium]|nr:hypothetical protein [Paludibacteraceae bacterium]